MRKRRKKEKRKAQLRAQKEAERERRRLEKQRSAIIAHPGEEAPLMLPAVLTDSDDGDDDGAPPPPPPPPPLSHAARAAGKRGTCERQPRTHICAHAHVAGWQFLAAAAA